MEETSDGLTYLQQRFRDVQPWPITAADIDMVTRRRARIVPSKRETRVIPFRRRDKSQLELDIAA